MKNHLPTSLCHGLLGLCLALLPLSLRASDSLSVETPRKSGWVARLVSAFSDQDTAYVEPQHYNWALMLQSVNTYDYYRLSSTGDNGQSISFAPELSVKAGPYFGWRWIFLGYTVDLRNINFFHGKRKLEIDGSIYSARFCADVYYRRSASGYKIRSVDFGDDINTAGLEGLPFNGLNVSITGLNLYYIFNARHFSYPAAFAQSTCQKISCGSWMAGLGYNRNKIDFDHRLMEDLVHDRLGQGVQLDNAMKFNNVRYRDISASVGYAYNWVFAHDWLFCSSISGALAYKASEGTTEDPDDDGFNFGNFNIDGVGRFGLVWNNTRWYAGASAILRAYNYHKSRFATNNIFGDLCVYVGLNFGPRKPYRTKKNKT